MSDPQNRNNNGKFVKGNNANPGGRPKTPDSLKIAFGELSELGVKCLRAVLDGSDTNAKTSDRVKASEIAFDRHLGKPTQTVNANVKTREIDISKLTPEQIDALTELALNELDDK